MDLDANISNLDFDVKNFVLDFEAKISDLDFFCQNQTFFMTLKPGLGLNF